MTNITPGSIVTVTTDNGVFETKRLVVTVGPWSDVVMAMLRVNLPFKFDVSVMIRECVW